MVLLLVTPRCCCCSNQSPFPQHLAQCSELHLNAQAHYRPSMTVWGGTHQVVKAARACVVAAVVVLLSVQLCCCKRVIVTAAVWL